MPRCSRARPYMNGSMPCREAHTSLLSSSPFFFSPTMVSPVASTSFIALTLYAALAHAAPSVPNARRAAPSGFSMKASGTGVRITDLGGASSAGGSGSNNGEAVTDVQDALVST